jgi:uncharacterized membrane protein
VRPFLIVLLVLATVWVALAVIGFIVKGLFWLAVVGVVFLVVTAYAGGSRRR